MRPYLLALLSVVALLLAGGCDLLSKDAVEEDKPSDFAVLIENRSNTPLSIIVAPQESFSDQTHLQGGQTRLVGVRGVRRGEEIVFEAAVRDVGRPWLPIAVRRCVFDGDLDKFRMVFFLGGLGCENW